MEYIIGSDNRQIVLGEDEWSGVKKIAAKVAGDIKLVTDAEYKVTESTSASDFSGGVYAATLGKSSLAKELLDKCGISEDTLAGKRECYAFQVVETVNGGSALVIVGSDKRGTIYGLFHISDLLGVSPWVYFADVCPKKRDSVALTDADNFVSKEPSVKYRGFFINDEWPSFGTWTFKHFGGFTAQMYEHVFELILRMKGNYLWPAMWTSNFSLDGPGLANAELADELGIVMSNSHHEPCLRHSEEWDLVKGDDTKYGSAWNFSKNREGLINYWRDGLSRNGKFENVVTMGMRGERDSEVLGREATLQDNIDYLKDVITVQNNLIKETISEDLDSVPRMLAIYKEVEKYFYGDETAEGLRYWPELDGITCMLCDDNFANMRKLPEEFEKDRRGGWGMYYHFDYHGDPISYEWVNSTHLSRVWEQMGQAYESGVRDIWIVNVGDLKPQELPLSFFMDLAYDFDKWGTSNTDSATEYLRNWVERQFAGCEDAYEDIYALLDTYTYVNSIRRPEALNERIYHPVNYGEAEYMLQLADISVSKAEDLWDKFKETPLKDAFYQLVYFPVCASMNLLEMQLFAGINHHLAGQGRPSANIYGGLINECMDRDLELQKGYYECADGKWDGIMGSEHMGFVHWNDEEARYPVVHTVIPSRRPRVVVAGSYSDSYTMGGDWTRHPIVLTGLCSPTCFFEKLELENAGTGDIEWKVTECDEWISLSASEGVLKEGDTDILVVTTGDNLPEGTFVGKFVIKAAMYKVEVYVCARNFTEEEAAIDHFVPVLPDEVAAFVKESDLELSIEAGELELSEDEDTQAPSYRIIDNYGKYGSAAKAFPVNCDFSKVAAEDLPSLTGSFYVPKDGKYEIRLITAPCNPLSTESLLRVKMAIDPESTTDAAFESVTTVGADYQGGERTCPEWAKGVLDNQHETVLTRNLSKGWHDLTILPQDPGVVIERLVIREAAFARKDGYLHNCPVRGF